jgi:hypothetical protein
VEKLGSGEWRELVVERDQGETNGIFTLMTSGISMGTLKISSTSKTHLVP